MSDAFHQLLDATLAHLQDLKAQGVRHVSVSPEALAALRQPVLPGPPSRTPLPKPQAPADSASPVQETVTPLISARSSQARLPDSAASSTPASTPTAPIVDATDRAQAMAALRQQALACVRCTHLAAARRNVVFGVGDIHAQLMFVGEAPGADEDRQGEPFVGAAGQLLTRMIVAMGLSRETVYIANILKCRPDTPGQASGNRKPTPEEMKTCLPYLLAQIDLIQPKVLVALGATAVEGLLGKTGITRLRGHWQTYRNIPLMPTYHPSYLLHNQALGERRKVWEDMMQVMEKLGLTISEKQRRFFQRAGGG